MRSSLRALLADQRTASASEEWRHAKFAVFAILALAVVHRLYLVFTIDYPINDGALFLQFVNMIVETFPRLPRDVPYNGLQIPFAYPPLSFWLAAALVQAGADPLEIVRVAPLLMNIVYLGLFALLLHRLNHSATLIAWSLFFFCTNFRSFEWLIMGGGIARGLGATLMLLALVLIAGPRGAVRGRRRTLALVGAGLCVGGAVLSHPQWGIVAAALAIAVLVFRSVSIASFVIRSLIVGMTATALVLPWALHILRVHGTEPFLAAAATSEHNLLFTTIVNLIKAVLINPFIGIGALILLVRRNHVWIVFLILCIILTPRLAPTVWALPIAVFAAQGVLASTAAVERLGLARSIAILSVGAAAIAVVCLRIERDARLSGVLYQPLDPDRRAAMNWVARNHPGETFAVVSTAPWYYDSSAEWFPLLTGSTNITTVQGREWLPNQQFQQWVEASEALKKSETCPQVIARLSAFGPARYVWAEQHRPCFEAAGMTPIFANARVAIYKARP